MRKICLLLSMLMILSLCCSIASAFTINNVRINNETPVGDDTYYTSIKLIKREPFMKNPVISFDVSFDKNAPKTLRYFAWITIGSNLYNSKDIYLGRETGSIRQWEAEKGILKMDMLLSPNTGPPSDQTWYDLAPGDFYFDIIPLNPSVSHYDYTLQHPETLCFDAHVYTLSIYVGAWYPPTEAEDSYTVSYTTGDDNEFKSYGSGDYNRRQQEFYSYDGFTAGQVYLKGRRVGVLPSDYVIRVSLRSSLNGQDLAWSQVTNTNGLLNLGGTDYEWSLFSFNKMTPSEILAYPDITTSGIPPTLSPKTKYYIYIKSTGGDSTHYLGFRYDTGLNYKRCVQGWSAFGYEIGLSYEYYRYWKYLENSGNPIWDPKNDNILFKVTGYNNPHWVIGSSWDSKASHTPFVFNTYGPDVDRSVPYDFRGWFTGLSNYAYTKDFMNISYNVFIGNAFPQHMNQQGGDSAILGAMFDYASIKNVNGDVLGETDAKSYVDAPIPLTYILCDKDRNVLEYKQIYSKFELKATAEYNSLSIPISQFTLSLGKIGEKKIEARSAYYLFIGVPVSGSFFYDTLYVTVDDTMRKTNWSTTNDYKTCIADDSLSKDFIGGYVYFETYPAYTEENTPGTMRTTQSWVTNFVIWCNNPPPSGLGLPFVPVLFAFIPAIIIVGAIYYFARKWEISIPNFIYSVAVISGMFITWQIGLLALWIFIFISASLLFISIYQFREPISKALNIVPSEVYNQKEVHHKLPESFRYQYSLKKPITDYGIAPIRKRWKERPGLKAFISSRSSSTIAQTGKGLANGARYSTKAGVNIGGPVAKAGVKAGVKTGRWVFDASKKGMYKYKKYNKKR
jgi:hypothetical protein